jgi:hypothetical protein
VYGVAYLVSVAKALRAKAPLDWDDHLRPANVKIALGICVLALLLAMPILDFGAMSARDQVARLKSGKTKEAEFDWKAMAFDFGPKGRAALTALSKTGSEFQKQSAKTALASDDRWDVESDVKVEQSGEWSQNFSYIPADKILDKKSRQELVRDGACRFPCRIIWLSDNRIIVVGPKHKDDNVRSEIYQRPTQAEVDAIDARNKANGNRYSVAPKARVWSNQYMGPPINSGDDVTAIAPDTKVEIRKVDMQQVYVDGKPIGEVFEK